MKKRKILIVFGTRPEAIKMAPVVSEFKKYPDHFRTYLCVTGQHRQLLDQVLTVFNLIPDFDLDIMQPDQDLYDIFTNIMLKVRKVYEDVTPDLVLVHGDTTTSTAAALSAFFRQIPVCHIEAGLRTNNKYSPWPEEMNRQITSRLATYHFAPTEIAKDNLIKENIDENSIYVTGNTIIDALTSTVRKIDESEDISRIIINQIKKSGYQVERISELRRLILITGHRRENLGIPFENICKAIKSLSEKYRNFDFLYPVHFNPNVRKSVNKILGVSSLENVFLIDPLDYMPFIFLMRKSFAILTDSGGIQEEAAKLGKPVLVMRDTTERPEALMAGISNLVGTNYDDIINSLSRLIEDNEVYNSMVISSNSYGDGKASEKIVNFLINRMKE